MKYLVLSRFQLRKKANFFTIFIISISICLVFLLSTYKKTQNAYYSNGVFKGIYYRFLEVYKSNDYQKDIDELLKQEYITDAVFSPYFQTRLYSDKFKTETLTGDIWIISSNEKNSLKIIDGVNFPDNNDYYMICPETFYPHGNTEDYSKFSKSDAVSLKSYIGERLPFYYYGRLYEGNNQKYKFNIDIQLVGTYENNKYENDEAICFVNHKAMEDIVKTQFTDYVNLDGKNVLENQSGIIITIDDIAHVSMVKETLKSMGYNYDAMVGIDYENLSSMNKLINSILSFIIILIFILIFLILEKDFRDSKNYFKLLAYLGYYKKDIRKVYFLSSFLKILFCLIIGCFLSFLFIIGFHIYLYYYPFVLGKFDIAFDYLSIFWIFLALFLALIIDIILNIKVVDVYE